MMLEYIDEEMKKNNMNLNLKSLNNIKKFILENKNNNENNNIEEKNESADEIQLFAINTDYTRTLEEQLIGNLILCKEKEEIEKVFKLDKYKTLITEFNKDNKNDKDNILFMISIIQKILTIDEFSYHFDILDLDLYFKYDCYITLLLNFNYSLEEIVQDAIKEFDKKC